jgi:hypothetical protein
MRSGEIIFTEQSLMRSSERASKRSENEAARHVWRRAGGGRRAGDLWWFSLEGR